MKHAAATLGSGNLRSAVMLPEGEDLNEWVAVNSKLLFGALVIAIHKNATNKIFILVFYNRLFSSLGNTFSNLIVTLFYHKSLELLCVHSY